MRYLLDEGWPPFFARLLNQQFYPEHDSPVVLSTRDLVFLGVQDIHWMLVLEQRAEDNNELWTVITRDKMRPHRKDMFASPLRFAILADDWWSAATRLELWNALSEYWPVLKAHAESASAHVFRLSRYGQIHDFSAPT